ncbi:uncharacterized protein LOC118279580 [Spodoptera frugiperda]|uniref:Uncharacterized protein LOC118279580 n=1 Tax=Spodoptera frugiperda TaxID=7108 RepID=A0A9R0F2Z6_SPOFR|nr:uncharacterized protein LOC118279580 [Spodoptera frugiperda]
MGIRNNSHGKVDKETQSPLLKIFKEIMTREKDDPEKRNLLMEQKEDKKRRQYSGSRTKIDRRSCESSSSEQRKRGTPYKTSSIDQRGEFPHNRNRSLAYPSEKKDSWWCWSNKDDKEKDKPKKLQSNDDTCSCVSCALRKLVGSEYACIGCLLLLFAISIIIAYLIICKGVPGFGGDDCKDKTTTPPTTTKCKKSVDSERLKRKIELLNGNRMNNDYPGFNDYDKDLKSYDDPMMSPNKGVAGIDFGPSFRELNSLDESESKMSGDVDWTNVLDADKNSELQGSDKLREFYKKLVQTDAKIKSLKRINQVEMHYLDDDLRKSPDRSKRSLKLYHYPKKLHFIRHRRSLLNKNNESPYLRRRAMNRTRLKRFSNESEEPTGFVIEKKKLLVQYKPAGRKKIAVKKCSHAPKDLHIHEHQLKHPFYKNTQRLDELLDRFLNKNLPEIMSDPFGLDVLFKQNPNKACKHPKPHKNVNIIGKEPRIDQIPKPKQKMKLPKEEKMETQSDLLKMLKPESTTEYEKDFYHHEAQMIGKERQKIVTASPNDFEVLLSVSTIMNPDMKHTKVGQVTSHMDKSQILGKVPNLRRLMQLENEEDENLGYEDFKEVLTDDMENHDEMDKSVDRKKRTDDKSQVPTDKSTKYNPPGVHNPNWKGPMPLYPDELNSMVKHGPPNSTKDHKEEKKPKPANPKLIEDLLLKRAGRDVSDVEYVEDYLKNKYDKLVEMAQAYSDYGVLDDKKDARNEKNSDETATDRRIKLSADDNIYGPNLVERLRSGRLPEAMTSAESIRRQRDVSESASPYTTEQPDAVSNTMFFSNPYSFGTISTYRNLPEGLSFQMKMPNKSKDEEVSLFNIFSKHVQFKSKTKAHTPHQTKTATMPTMKYAFPELNEFFKVNKTETPSPITEKATPSLLEGSDPDSGIIFALSKNKRTLLSTNFEDVSESFHQVESTTANPEVSENSIDSFVKDLDIQSNSAANKKALAHYIEVMRQKNIKIFSTAHPDYMRISTTAAPFNEVPTYVTLNASLTSTSSSINDKPLITDTVVTINRSDIKMDDYTGNNYLGQIMLTVQNPDFGIEHINLMFDVPLIINFNEEPMMIMNDSLSFPETDNQFDAFPEAVRANETEPQNFVGSSFENTIRNRTIVKRSKAFSNLTATWIDFNATDTTETTTPMNVNSSFSNSNTNVSMVAHRSLNSTFDSDNMTLSDFFAMVSDWFKAFEDLKGAKPRQNSLSDLSDMLKSSSSSANTSTEPNVTTPDTTYPLYDSSNDNIGHMGNISRFKSRVLLSIDESPTNATEKTVDTTSNVTTPSISLTSGNVTNTTSPSTPLLNLNSNTTTKQKAKQKAITKPKAPEAEKKLKVKAIFKRNAEDSNLIFWNDIYDDEYGVQADKLDNSVRDKHSVKDNDFIQRSGRWVHEKIKKFAENLKMNPHIYNSPIDRSGDTEPKDRVPRSVKNNEMASYPKNVYEKIYKHRVGRQEAENKDDDDLDADQKSIFLALTANMRDVCRKAAKAVQQTRNLDSPTEQGKPSNTAKTESREGSIASALMQQLVRLLTDLVDYQVQQKTCSKLPTDLQSFLEWLTYPKEEVPEPQQPETMSLSLRPPYQDEDVMEQMQEMQTESSDDLFASVSNNKKFEDDHDIDVKQLDRVNVMDVRAHYMDCLHSLKELLDQYEDMTDEDKSKMMGVKSYLDSQVNFLNKQMSGYDLYSLFDKQNLVRLKRDTKAKKRPKRLRLRRKLNKFIKSFGKKHTRTTASFYDGVQVTDMKRVTIKNDDIIATVDTNDKLAKRNLKDVYYKAVADAKKHATATKNVHKNSEVTHESSTMKMQK